MPIFIPKKREFWLRKPQGLVSLNNRYSEDNFTNAYIFQSSATLPLTPNDIVSETGISYDTDGMHVDGADGSKILLDAPIDVSSGEGALILRVKKGFNTGGIQEGVFSDKTDANWGTTGLSLNIRFDGGILLNIGASNIAYTTDNHFLDLAYHDVIVLYSAGNTSRIFIDGTEISYNLQDVTASSIPASSLDAKIGAYYTDSGSFRSKVSLHYLYSFNYRMGLDEALGISEAPYQILKPRKSYFLLNTAAGGAALAGNATGQAIATGDISTAINAAGDATGQATASGSLTTDTNLSGAAVIIATANGTITASIDLSGVAASVSIANGALTVGVNLTGAAIGQALAAAGLDTQTLFAASAQGEATGAGTLTTGDTFSGDATAQATAAADITVQITLDGAAIAQALATAGLTTSGSGFEGHAQGTASLDGLINTSIDMIGSPTAVATGGANFSTILQLMGAAAAASNATGGLTIGVTFNGAALITALASGDLTTLPAGDLAGDALASALAGGALTTSINLNGSAVATANASGALLGNLAGFIDNVQDVFELPTQAYGWTLPAEPYAWQIQRSQ